MRDCTDVRWGDRPLRADTGGMKGTGAEGGAGETGESVSGPGVDWLGGEFGPGRSRLQARNDIGAAPAARARVPSVGPTPQNVSAGLAAPVREPSTGQTRHSFTRLSDALAAFNVAATGIAWARELSAELSDDGATPASTAGPGEEHAGSRRSGSEMISAGAGSEEPLSRRRSRPRLAGAAARRSRS